MDYRILWAMTYYRENRPGRRRKAFSEVALEAHQQNLPIEEAECHRDMALFNPDAESAMGDLDAARPRLAESGTPRREHEHRTRHTLADAILHCGACRPCERRVKALEPLNSMAQTNRNNLIQNSYHSANGAVLLLQGKYSDAISELEEDSRESTFTPAARQCAGQGWPDQPTRRKRSSLWPPSTMKPSRRRL